MNTMSNTMQPAYILEVAKTISAQLYASVDSRSVIWSWGLSKMAATAYKNMPALRLRVSGLMHKGYVYICLNEGRDVYEVFCVSLKGNVKQHNDEVYCDNLGFVVDGMIERPHEMSDETYSKKAMRDSAKKMGMSVID